MMGPFLELKLPNPGWLLVRPSRSLQSQSVPSPGANYYVIREQAQAHTPTSHSWQACASSEIRHGERCARRPTTTNLTRTRSLAVSQSRSLAQHKTKTRHQGQGRAQHSTVQYSTAPAGGGTGTRGRQGCESAIKSLLSAKLKLTITATAPPLPPPSTPHMRRFVSQNIMCWRHQRPCQLYCTVFHYAMHGSVHAQTPAIRTRASLNVSLAGPPRPSSRLEFLT